MAYLVVLLIFGCFLFPNLRLIAGSIFSIWWLGWQAILVIMAVIIISYSLKQSRLNRNINNAIKTNRKIPCIKCRVFILPTTAQKTDGKCMPCFNGFR
jgi:hypothetical protein